MKEQDPIAERARKALDESTDHLDMATRMALTRARKAATLAAANSRSKWWQPYARPWVGATALVVVCLSVFVAIQAPNDKLAATSEFVESVELEILAQEDNYELYEELEFYRWLPTRRGRG
ncbi:MAG: hypothetical protein K0U93_05235 [Gammaproteobacteria bacterium]|nr:hypothetical protein [Gammaproteobacteria bacterium]